MSASLPDCIQYIIDDYCHQLDESEMNLAIRNAIKRSIDNIWMDCEQQKNELKKTEQWKQFCCMFFHNDSFSVFTLICNK